MRITLVFVVMLFCNSGLYAQADTTKIKSTASANASIIADINLMYENMEQVIKGEYARLINENKKKSGTEG